MIYSLQQNSTEKPVYTIYNTKSFVLKNLHTVQPFPFSFNHIMYLTMQLFICFSCCYQLIGHITTNMKK